jgi:hypothetical protein
MESFAKTLLGFGALAMLVGGLFLLFAKLGIRGMPGDISFQKGSWHFFFPIGTSIIISIVVTVLLNLFRPR